MKILVIALEGVVAELLFEDEQLTNFHRLMEFGCYGRLAGDPPSSREEAWLSIASGRNPGSLQDGSGLRPLTLWDQIARQGKRAVIAGTAPFELAGGEGLIVHHLDGPALAGLDAHASEDLVEQVYSLSRKQFDAVRGLLSGEAWDFLQFFETGLGQIQRVFARSQSIDDRLAPELDDVYHPAVRDYHRYLDGQVGDILETLADEAAIAVISIQHAVPDRRGAEVTSPEPVPMGFFILAASNNPLNGEIEAVSLSDIAPTLLELAGYDIPTSMQGRSLVAGEVIEVSAEAGLTSEEEEILRERLSGLGYIG